jgi:Secretion system C-terminal sorting domain
MKNLIYIFIVTALIPFTFLNAQGPGAAYFPETANGATNVGSGYFNLKWQNPLGTIYNEVYLSYDSSSVAAMDDSVRIYNGDPDIAYDSIIIPQQLFMLTRYYWRVIEYNNSGSTVGPIWYFYTDPDQYVDYYYTNNDFTDGTDDWIIASILGTCQWELGSAEDYYLPAPAYGNVLAANDSACGGSYNTIAQLPHLSNLVCAAGWIEFNSDWKTDNPIDSALVEYSIDSGVTWDTAWTKVGISDRNKHISAIIFENTFPTDTVSNLDIRFRTVQNGSSSWWAIDNVSFNAWTGVLTPLYLNHLHTFVIDNRHKVSLHWSQNLGVPGISVYRKTGLPLDTNSYQYIGWSNGYVYIDSTIQDSTIYTYKVGYQRYSNEATAYVFPPLPVELISFSGSVIDGKAQLNWSTATETNNRGFEIERLKDSKIEKLKDLPTGQAGWENIGFVEGNGTTTQPHNYSFIDNKNLSGTYKYRLKQIDFDGSFKYSNTVEVSITSLTEFSLEQNYPNPFNPTTIIIYSIPREGNVTLKVFDVLGREVATLVNKVQKAGEYTVDFDGSKLTSGVYFYKLTLGKYNEVKKMLLLK